MTNQDAKQKRALPLISWTGRQLRRWYSTTMKNRLPADFDPELYLRLHPDVAAAGADPANHYLRFGRAEGRRYRPGHAPRNRDDFLRQLELYEDILEVGPFDRPVAPIYASPSATVEYADWQSQEALQQRAATIPGRNPAGVPRIGYVTAGPLGSVIAKRFDCVVSIHMIEHVPDLVAHLQEVRLALKPGGRYVFVAPDKRHCFDHFLPETALPEVVAAFVEKRTRPTLRSVIEHRAFTAHDYKSATDPTKAPSPDIWARVQSAAREHATEDYVDVHCWQFTPESLAGLIAAIARLGLLDPPTSLATFQLGPEVGGEIRW